MNASQRFPCSRRQPSHLSGEALPYRLAYSHLQCGMTGCDSSLDRDGDRDCTPRRGGSAEWSVERCIYIYRVYMKAGYRTVGCEARLRRSQQFPNVGVSKRTEQGPAIASWWVTAASVLDAQRPVSTYLARSCPPDGWIESGIEPRWDETAFRGRTTCCIGPSSKSLRR